VLYFINKISYSGQVFGQTTESTEDTENHISIHLMNVLSVFSVSSVVRNIRHHIYEYVYLVANHILTFVS